MNPRIRRLQSDHQKVMAAFADHPRIRVIEVVGTPPERYIVELSVRSLVPEGESGFREGTTHRAEIFLSLDYPRRPPFCRMVTPVYHPNIDPQKICIGDHWSAGQGLPTLLVRIAEMLAYQSYNTKSPLNGQAAAWAEENEDRLPLEEADMSAGCLD